MKVKICGLNPVRDVQLCIDLKVNYLGFVFYEKSPRNLVLQDIEVLKNFNKQVSSFVAVTVNAKNEFIENVVLKNFDYIQLHGNESNNRIKEIKSMGIKTIKTVKISEYSDIHQYKNFSEADIILFDTPGMEKSIKFPKELISKLPKGENFALAGSISQNNIENIAKLGISFFDLSSSLELDGQIGYKEFIKKNNEIKN